MAEILYPKTENMNAQMELNPFGNGIKLRKSRITHSVVWDFFMEKY